MVRRDIKQRVLSHLAEAACQWHRTARKNGVLRVVAVPLGEGTASTKRRFYNYFGDAEGAGLALLSGGLTPSSSTSKINIELGAISGPTERSPYARFGGMKN